MADVLRRVGVIAAVVVLTSPAAASAETVDLGVFAGPVRVHVDGEEILTVRVGEGERQLAETVEFHATGSTITVVNDVSMQGYLEGIAEVPVRWPEEALKAQVVAARTYAWRTMRTDGARPYAICATVACQVFRGREIVRGPGGDRWAAAVAETEDEVLLHEGRPILARYFSTSGGHTRNNEHVFPSSGAYPYLRGVPDPEDEVSPLHRWQVRFARDEFDAILSRGQQLGRAVPVARAEIIPAGDGHPDRVRLISTDGVSATVNASTFRSFISTTAPELFPGRYPPTHTTGRPLPETMPSSRIRFEITDDEVVIHGNGYGHGVGMSQYGAMGKAEAGMAYGDILAAYYGGIRPTRDPRVPRRVRVGVADDADRYSFRATAASPVRVGDRTVTERGLGTWAVERTGEGVRLLAPGGFGAPLVVGPPRVATDRLTTIHRVTVSTVVNKPAEVWLSVRDPSGDEVEQRPPGVVDAGEVVIDWTVGDVPPGRYEVAVRARDEESQEAGDPITVEVVDLVGDASASASLLGPPPVRGRSPYAPLAAGIIGAVVGAVVARRIEVT